MEKWDWLRNFMGGALESQLSSLVDVLQNITLTEEPDKWWWCLNRSLEFTVKDIRQHINEINLPYLGLVTRWNRFVSRKINIFILRLLLDRLLTKLNILKKGMDIPTIMCSICDGYVENLEHLLIRCEVVART